ncbi:hypothetical protein [Bradyrhizobium manausense]|uniref:hypothetical protein n=1 Tax=Bradyrhizobium manausense TaxID=989370 RepID=UPI000B197EEE|nr:hypothetical protein [Bradyrhizobium manausense]
MNHRFLFIVCTIALAGISDLSLAQPREILLNQIDPQGATLALAIIPRASELPTWVQRDNLNHVSVEIKQRSDTTGDAFRRRSGSATTSEFAVRLNTAGSGERRLRLGATSGPSIDISRTDDTLAGLPGCDANSMRQAPCRITDLGKQVVLAVASHARGRSTPLARLIAVRGLTADDRSAKRVVVTVDENNTLLHVDFVGLVRSATKKPDAPDASSAFVVRLGRAGNFSIIERQQDAAIDPLKIKFVGEE